MFTSWSPSRLEKYEQCPLKAKLELIDKLCPSCFKGRVTGGFDSPAICDTCGAEVETGDALVRGTEIHASLEAYIKGEGKKLHKDIRHPAVLKLVKDLRKEKAKVRTELDIVLDKNWQPISKFTKGAWLRAKVDVLHMVTAVKAKVLDWKTGGIDKRTGAVRAEAKYDDALDIYATVTLSSFPQLEEVTTHLVFTDCGPRHEPEITRPVGLKRSALAKAQKDWEKRIKPMFADKTFAPRPSDKCRWCPFSKGKGGPCRY